MVAARWAAAKGKPALIHVGEGSSLSTPSTPIPQLVSREGQGAGVVPGRDPMLSDASGPIRLFTPFALPNSRVVEGVLRVAPQASHVCAAASSPSGVVDQESTGSAPVIIMKCTVKRVGDPMALREHQPARVFSGRSRRGWVAAAWLRARDRSQRGRQPSLRRRRLAPNPEALRLPARTATGCPTVCSSASQRLRTRSRALWRRTAASWISNIFCRQPGVIDDHSSGAVACDHYHRWKSDVDLMARLNTQTYRFSVAWPRIMPDGRGRVNTKGLDFYRRLVDRLHAAAIVPMATLYHWDLPQALQDRGGWQNRDCAEWFANFAAVVFERLPASPLGDDQ